MLQLFSRFFFSMAFWRICHGLCLKNSCKGPLDTSSKNIPTSLAKIESDYFRHKLISRFLLMFFFECTFKDSEYFLCLLQDFHKECPHKVSIALLQNILRIFLKNWMASFIQISIQFLSYFFSIVPFKFIWEILINEWRMLLRSYDDSFLNFIIAQQITTKYLISDFSRDSVKHF